MAPEVVAYRLEVLETVLKAGDPIARVDAYRRLFERGGYSLTDSSHMRQLVPVLARRYLSGDKAAVASRLLVVLFDGTSHFGELLLVFVRFWDGNNFQQRLIRLRHSEIPLDQNILGALLLLVLQKLDINGSQVLAFVKDTASVNFAAVNALKANGLGLALNLPCWSHNFDRVGRRLKLDLAKQFISHWSQYFSKSYKVLSI